MNDSLSFAWGHHVSCQMRKLRLKNRSIAQGHGPGTAQPGFAPKFRARAPDTRVLQGLKGYRSLRNPRTSHLARGLSLSTGRALLPCCVPSSCQGVVPPICWGTVLGTAACPSFYPQVASLLGEAAQPVAHWSCVLDGRVSQGGTVDAQGLWPPHFPARHQWPAHLSCPLSSTCTSPLPSCPCL